MFAFHGNINRVFYGTEAGEYNGETRQKIGHEWIFETERYKLKSGDVLHCWIYVQHDKHAYQMQKQFTFPGLYLINCFKPHKITNINL